MERKKGKSIAREKRRRKEIGRKRRSIIKEDIFGKRRVRAVRRIGKMKDGCKALRKKEDKKKINTKRRSIEKKRGLQIWKKES